MRSVIAPEPTFTQILRLERLIHVFAGSIKDTLSSFYSKNRKKRRE